MDSKLKIAVDALKEIESGRVISTLTARDALAAIGPIEPDAGQVLPAGVTLRAFQAHDDHSWWISIKHPFGSTNIKAKQGRDVQFAQMLASPPANIAIEPDAGQDERAGYEAREFEAVCRVNTSLLTQQRERAEKAEAERDSANKWREKLHELNEQLAGRVLALQEKLDAQPAPQDGQVDWIGLALNLDVYADTTESNTARRAIKAGAHGLRLMGAALAAPPASAWTTEQINHAASVSGIGASDKARWFASMIMAGPDSMVQPDFEASAKLNGRAQ